MSCLDSTTETIREMDFTLKPKVREYTKTITLYGNDLKLTQQSQIFHYFPNDMTIFHSNYKLDKDLIFSENLSPSMIFSAVDKTTGERVAIKQLTKDKLKEDYLHEMARNELSIGYSLSKNSQNIVKVYDYFEDSKGYYLSMELAQDPTHFEDLLENRYCPVQDEKVLKAHALDILNGLRDIHNNNIIHCDIKPQNFLLFDIQNSSMKDTSNYEAEDDKLLKITDFGLAHILPEGQEKTFMLVPCGTYAYTAPEIKKNCFIDKSIDIWSFGICLYQMAVAYLPTAIKQYRYGKGPIPFRSCDWSEYDFNNLKDLIENCLQIDPKNRISAHDALNHPWFEL